MKIFHLSYHVGCINDINYVFTRLGHNIDFEHCKLPFTITQDIAQKYWSINKDKLQSYDIIITSDTVALSYIFLLHLDYLIPHLIIYNCNRFDYNMYSETQFYDLLRGVKNKLSKVTYIPFTTFETIWCNKHDITIYEYPITPIGKCLEYYTDKCVTDDFGIIERDNCHLSDDQTIFIQKYFNHTQFMDLTSFLSNEAISVAHGGYSNLNQINNFKGVVVLPDAFCKYFAFESIQNNILVYVPSHKFLLELVNMNRYFFNIEGSGGRLTKELVNLCEWYRFPETRIFFESFEDLIVKIKETTPALKLEKNRWMTYYGAVLEKTELQKWQNICDKILINKINTLNTLKHSINYPEIYDNFKDFKQVIVWGFPIHSHTHSYIHAAWVKTFKYLNIPVHWFHDKDYPRDFDYTNSCFITEGWADENIPVLSSCTYFVHIARNTPKYLEKGARLIDIRYNVLEINDFNYSYTFPVSAINISDETVYEVVTNNSAVSKGGPVCQIPYEAIYMYWATDLLPCEFDYSDASRVHENVIHYIGSTDINHPFFDFKQQAELSGILVNYSNPWSSPIDSQEHIKMIKQSYCAPDFRSKFHIDIGYIPCRVFKAISYGHTGITNSKRVKDILQDHIEYIDKPSDTLTIVEKRKTDIEWRIRAMKHVAEHHTFLQRVRDLAIVLSMKKNI